MRFAIIFIVNYWSTKNSTCILIARYLYFSFGILCSSAIVFTLFVVMQTDGDCSPVSGIILAQNDDGLLKWAIGPYPIQIHANFQILMGLLKFS